MALSVKFALLSCLGFISGMCWLVNQVARPVVELPRPPVITPADATVPASTQDGRADRLIAAARELERAAPVLSAPPAQADALEVPGYLSSAEPAPRDDLPPLVSAAAPAAAQNVEPPAAGPTGAVQRLVADSSTTAPLIEVVDAATPRSRADVPAMPEDAPSPAPSRYRVVKGDSLVRIARRAFGSDDRRYVEALVAANPQVAERRNRILVGETLVIPAPGAADGDSGETRASMPVALASEVGPPIEAPRSAVKGDAATPSFTRGRNAKEPARTAATGDADAKSKPAAAARTSAREPKSVARKPAAAPSKPKGGTRSSDSRTIRGDRWYTVKPSDSLVEIARRELKNPDRWREIAEMNGLRDANKVQKGARLKLPSAGRES
ncbi:MAG: LysM peptidoglycan-binding domain-containing protein [Phycisphaerae bacterium]|jgi:nucleoid-associated protein YgaU